MKQITIATYNIRHGHDVNLDWNKIAEVVCASGADIIGFQEIDMHTNRIGGKDTVSGLVTATGLPYCLFVPAMDFDGGQYGTAILSRFPITSYTVHPLNSGCYEPRSFGCITVALHEKDALYFLNTHLSYESQEQQDVQFAEIFAWMEKHLNDGIPTILTGDFNTENFHAFHAFEAAGFALINNRDHTYKTFRNPPAAIDNIVYRKSRLKPMEFGMIDSNRSDHNLLWCRFACP